jgi:uncharacterized protein YndB with AHSA1/START domain
VRGRDPGPPLPATLSPAGDDRWALVLERAFDHPPAEVWAALVEPDRQAEWAPFRSDRDLTAPGPATLTMLGGEEEVALPGDVIAATPPRLLEHRWDADLVRWELTELDGGTLLRLRHAFGDRPWAPSYGAGWQICLDILQLLLAGTPRGPVVGEDARAWGWEELRDRYADALGVDDGER